MTDENITEVEPQTGPALRRRQVPIVSTDT
jgi:hypothetical protein